MYKQFYSRPSANSHFRSGAMLADSLKTGCRHAFETVYTNYSPALNGVIFRTIRDRHLSEDILQNVFIKIWQNIGQYDAAKASLFTWMLTICRNEMIDFMRSKQAQQTRRTIMLVDVLHDNASEPCWDRPDVRYFYKLLLPKDKVLVELIYLRGFTFKQTAQLLDMPVGTVKTRMRTILRRLPAAVN